jgi:hypothetical protein
MWLTLRKVQHVFEAFNKAVTLDHFFTRISNYFMGFVFINLPAQVTLAYSSFLLRMQLPAISTFVNRHQKMLAWTVQKLEYSLWLPRFEMAPQVLLP